MDKVNSIKIVFNKPKINITKERLNNLIQIFNQLKEICSKKKCRNLKLNNLNKIKMANIMMKFLKKIRDIFHVIFVPCKFSYL
jgi:hypothetical protein